MQPKDEPTTIISHKNSNPHKKTVSSGVYIIISRENRIDRTYIFRSSESLKFALLGEKGLRKSHLPDHRKTLSGMRD